jgi:hypothetical protein
MNGELRMNKSTIKRAKQEIDRLAEKTLKKPYVSPRLVECGNVAKLTSSGGTTAPFDGQMVKMISLVCL